MIAKLGLVGISGDLGLAIRTCFVFVFVLMFAGVVVPAGHGPSRSWELDSNNMREASLLQPL